jgi:hypothetical protein
LQVSCLQAAMVPMGVAASVATVVRPRARPLAHASMAHASTCALTTCHPCVFAGAAFFEFPRLMAMACCRPSWPMPTTRGRQRRQLDRRGLATLLPHRAPRACLRPHDRACLQVLVKGHQWPPMAHCGQVQCCGWWDSHFGPSWRPLGSLTVAGHNCLKPTVTYVTDVL